jgi:hypothetical protein
VKSAIGQVQANNQVMTLSAISLQQLPESNHQSPITGAYPRQLSADNR